eukprot:Rhum_TRINITY_DN15493_c1_g1::Rhum_TRINITY_DN15493_c1_g1_i1::g.159729::m.159729
MGGCVSKKAAPGPKGDFVGGKPAIQVKPAPEQAKTEQDVYLHNGHSQQQQQQQARDQPSDEQPLFRAQAAPAQPAGQHQTRALPAGDGDQQPRVMHMRIQRATPGQPAQEGQQVMMVRRSDDPSGPAAGGAQGEQQECKVQ